MQIESQKFRRGLAAAAECRTNFRYRQMIRSAASGQNSDRSCSAVKIPIDGRSGIPQSFGNSVSDYYIIRLIIRDEAVHDIEDRKSVV